MSTKLRPLGRLPVSDRDGVGKPVAVTENDPTVPTVNVVAAALVIAADLSTVRVKLCVAAVPMPLLAVIVNGKTPPMPFTPPLRTVPLRVAVPSPLSTKVTPDGRLPDSVRAALGLPVVVTLKVPSELTVKVALAELVMAGAWCTVKVKVCVASGTVPLWAVKVRVYVPPMLAAGVPASMPVAGVKVTPVGRVPDSVRVGAGKPETVTEKVPAVPTVKVVAMALVKAGA